MAIKNATHMSIFGINAKAHFTKRKSLHVLNLHSFELAIIFLQFKRAYDVNGKQWFNGPRFVTEKFPSLCQEIKS